nr:MAG TPA: hypothetical protein [Caudoviricetes sp.]
MSRFREVIKSPHFEPKEIRRLYLSIMSAYSIQG